MSYEDVATKFFEHFLAIAGAANNAGLWDEQDSYFYDVLHLADGQDIPIKVKSLVGLVPISAALSYDGMPLHDLPDFRERGTGSWRIIPNTGSSSTPGTSAASGTGCWRWCPRSGWCCCWTMSSRRTACCRSTASGPSRPGTGTTRSASRSAGSTASVDYEPAESTTNLFGGNSNWRGPIWMPLNVLLVEALRNYDKLAPGEVTVEYPAGSGSRRTLSAAADDISRRLMSIFLPGPDGRRPVHGWYDLLATDPRWKDNIPFHEYFHGDTGMGLGAEHQTGWTALVAHLILTTPPRQATLTHRSHVHPAGATPHSQQEPGAA